MLVIVAVTTTRQLSWFSLSKDDLFPLFWVVISENGKIIWRLVVTATILPPARIIVPWLTVYYGLPEHIR